MLNQLFKVPTQELQQNANKNSSEHLTLQDWKKGKCRIILKVLTDSSSAKVCSSVSSRLAMFLGSGIWAKPCLINYTTN